MMGSNGLTSNGLPGRVGPSAPNCISLGINRTGNVAGKRQNSYLFGEENIQ